VTVTLDAAALAGLAEEPVNWRYKGMPAQWAGLTPAAICAGAPHLFEAGPLGPVCVLRADALAHNLTTMSRWCAARGVELAPHGKTHMSPQLYAKQVGAGAWAVTVATISQARTYRAFGAQRVLLANELVDEAGLRWLASESNADPRFSLLCWVDSTRGVEIMTDTLDHAGMRRPLDVCVEVGAAGGRTGCRSERQAEAVAQAVLASPRLRLVGVSGYEGALGHDVSEPGRARIRDYLSALRATVLRLGELFESPQIVVSAGGSTHFDLVAEMLTGWPDGLAVRTVLRSGCYLTHDDGLYLRTSPLRFRPALSVWAQVCSVPEPGLAVLTMGRRDVSFDQDLPVPTEFADCEITKLNDQHAYLRLGPSAAGRIGVGSWMQFGISHPCTVLDKWTMIPVLDADGRVVELIRTFF
jgi:D-serine deaminase-like pyridoxal phosphate-dependent protein